MIINIGEKIPLFSRYNGGWIKTITKIDKDYKNGYSLVGEFLPVSCGNIDLDEDILYLDCSITGSRKNQERNYTLFKIIENDVIIIKEIEDGGRDWAMSLWETIDSELQTIETPVQKVLKQIKKLNDTEFFEMINNLRQNDERYQKIINVIKVNETLSLEKLKAISKELEQKKTPPELLLSIVNRSIVEREEESQN